MTLQSKKHYLFICLFISLFVISCKTTDEPIKTGRWQLTLSKQFDLSSGDRLSESIFGNQHVGIVFEEKRLSLEVDSSPICYGKINLVKKNIRF